MTDRIRIAALLGSLRRASLNRALLEAARENAPEGVEILPFDLRGVPFYDGDLEAAGDPKPVRLLKRALRDADALLVVTPEYNHSLPAVLKNAIDWASRPPSDSVLAGKPVLILGASSGRSATKYALAHAHDVLAHARALPFERRLGVPLAATLLDAEGRMADPGVRAELAELLADFATAVRVGADDRARADAAAA